MAVSPIPEGCSDQCLTIWPVNITNVGKKNFNNNENEKWKVL
jgi:hypothetical protein